MKLFFKRKIHSEVKDREVCTALSLFLRKVFPRGPHRSKEKRILKRKGKDKKTMKTELTTSNKILPLINCIIEVITYDLSQVKFLISSLTALEKEEEVGQK